MEIFVEVPEWFVWLIAFYSVAAAIKYGTQTYYNILEIRRLKKE